MLACTAVITVPVPLDDRRYDVRIGRVSAAQTAETLATALGETTGVAVLVDGGLGRASPRLAPIMAALTKRLPNVRRHDLPAGESSKTMMAVAETCEWMAAQGFDRGASVIAIGGGAACDHGGFAAAIYLRGIPFASCPTTLLAMVDASVGGKTGVDLAAGKNLVGAFHQPRAVIADLGFFDTLPKRERTAGMAEVVKAGLIGDPKLFDRLEAEVAAIDGWSLETWAQVVAAAVQVKVDVVTADEREGDRRAILNFGHTIGHALEAASQYDLLHGEAVSLGMMAALALGTSRKITPATLVPQVETLLRKLALPVDFTHRLNPEVLTRVEVDKKRRSDKVRFVFVPRIGEATMEDVPIEELKRQTLALT